MARRIKTVPSRELPVLEAEITRGHVKAVLRNEETARRKKEWERHEEEAARHNEETARYNEEFARREEEIARRNEETARREEKTARREKDNERFLKEYKEFHTEKKRWIEQLENFRDESGDKMWTQLEKKHECLEAGGWFDEKLKRLRKRRP